MLALFDDEDIYYICPKENDDIVDNEVKKQKKIVKGDKNDRQGK